MDRPFHILPVIIFSQFTGTSLWFADIWKGRKEIPEFYSKLLNEILVPDMEFESKHEVIVDNIAYMVWSGKCVSHQVSLGVGNFVVKDGAITCLGLYMERNFKA